MSKRPTGSDRVFSHHPVHCHGREISGLNGVSHVSNVLSRNCVGVILNSLLNCRQKKCCDENPHFALTSLIEARDAVSSFSNWRACSKRASMINCLMVLF